MKNIIRFVAFKGWLAGLLVLIMAGTAYSQNWQHQDVNTNYNLNNVFFLDSETGWAAGASGRIYKTTNGGQIWKEFYTGASSTINDFHFIDSDNGWLVADNGIRKTEDGGENWSSVSTSSMLSVFFIDEENGWASGAGGSIFRAADSGNTWSVQTSNTGNDLNNIFFINSNTGWAAGEGGTVVRTTNGGTSWSNLNAGLGVNLQSIFFIDSNTGWAVGDDGKIFHTTDAGQSWQTQDTGTPSDLYDVYFIDENHGWAVGSDGTILKTENGGDNWSSESSGTNQLLFSVHMHSAGTGWAAGNNGVMLSYGDHPRLSPPELVSPDDSATDVIFRPQFEWEGSSNAETFNLQISTGEDFSDSDLILDETEISESAYTPDEDLDDETEYFWRVQAVNSEGGTSSWTAARSFTTTRFWIPQDLISAVDLSDIYFADTKTGWVSGESGAIWHTTDAGENWETQTTPISNNLNALHFADAQTGWAVGNEGTIIHTQNGGANWSSQGSEISSTLLDVHFADASTGWVAGVNGFLSKSSDGGSTWEELDAGTSEALWGIHFINGQVGWIAGANGTIARTDNGGESWQIQESNVSGTLNNIFFRSAEYGWAIGNNGIALRTINGGAEWEVLDTGKEENLLDVGFVTNERGWIIGENGLILSTEDGGDTWVEQKSNTTENLTGIHFNVAEAGWIAGAQGTILKWYEEPIDVPVLVAPVDDDIQVDNTPTFSWESVTGAESYILQISTEASFNPDFVVAEQTGLTGTSVTLSRALNANTEYFWRVRAVNSEGNAGGWSQVFSFTTGLSWKEQESGVSDIIYDLFFTDEENGWAVGDEGIVLRTSDGGDNWELVTTGSEINYRGVHFNTPENGFIIGTGGTLLHTQDSGETWDTRSTGTENALLSIDFFDENTGLIVGVGGTIFRTTDGGGTWNSVNSGVSEHLWSVYYLDEDEVWAAGTEGTIIHSVDGGETWEFQQTFVSGYDIYGIYFLDNNRGWATGTEGILLTTTNGGINWDYEFHNETHLYKVYFTDENNGWISSTGSLLHTTDKGESWNTIGVPTSESLFALTFAGPGKGWAAGTGGAIVHYSQSVSEIPAPVLEFPVAGEEGISLLPRLTWESIDEASEYQVQVGTDSNFGFDTKVDDDEVSSTFYTPRELEFGSVYYWRVRGIDSDGFGGSWSEAQSFTTVKEGDIYGDLEIADSRLSVSGSFSLNFNLGIEESSIIDALTITDTESFAYTLSVTGSEESRGAEVRIHSETSFRSSDEITVTIDASKLKSRSGYDLSGLDTTFTFSTSFLGDFDNDAEVNSSDLAEVTSRWKMDDESDISLFDIGPANGTDRQFRAEPDGVIDFEDLIMFAFNWNLSMSGSKEQGKIVSQAQSAANQNQPGRNKPKDTVKQAGDNSSEKINDPGGQEKSKWAYFKEQAKKGLKQTASGITFNHTFEEGEIRAGDSAERLKAELVKSSSANRNERVKLLVRDSNELYQTSDEVVSKNEQVALVLTQPDSLIAYEVYVQAPEGVSLQDIKAFSVFEKYRGQSFILSKTHTDGNGFIITTANLGKGLQLAEGDTLATFSLNNKNSGPADLSVIYTLNESTDKVYSGVYSTVAETVSQVPAEFELLENYPNPFNPTTEIRYHLPEKAHVRITIYDILGRRISTITDQQLEAGFYRARWDATRYASGVYLYVIQVKSESGRKHLATKKMTLIK